jgi:hypothetical protein
VKHWRLAATDTSQDQDEGESGNTQPRDTRYGAALFHASILTHNASRLYMEWRHKGARGTDFRPVFENSNKRLQVLCVFTLGEGHHAGEMEVVPHPVGAQPHLLTIIRQRARTYLPANQTALAGDHLRIAEERLNSESR